MWLLDLAVQEEFTRFHLSLFALSGRADAASDDHLIRMTRAVPMTQIFEKARDLLQKAFAATQIASSGNGAGRPGPSPLGPRENRRGCGAQGHGHPASALAKRSRRERLEHRSQRRVMPTSSSA